jgi:hypothetical protein
MAAACAFSGSIALVCLGAALSGGGAGPACGGLSLAIAAWALGRRALYPDCRLAPLRLCPRRRVLSAEDAPVEGGDGESELRVVGITRSLICLALPRPGRRLRPVWRDSIAPEAFRRIAAYALWRRSVAPESAHRSELIARNTVTDGQTVPRTGRPRGR